MPILPIPRWLPCLVCLALPRLAAQTPAPYTPGPVLRIDLEGFHKIINRAPPVQPYAAGPVLRIDLEGLHRIRKLP